MRMFSPVRHPPYLDVMGASDHEREEIPTFLAAGHETTATLTSWMLFRLGIHPDVQAALRAECRAHPLPTRAHANAPLEPEQLSALDKLPWLDAVIRETLRLDAPVALTDRTPITDAVLPLDEPVVDRHGQIHQSLALPAGTVLSIPISVVNSLEQLWGPDGQQWRFVAGLFGYTRRRADGDGSARSAGLTDRCLKR